MIIEKVILIAVISFLAGMVTRLGIVSLRELSKIQKALRELGKNKRGNKMKPLL